MIQELLFSGTPLFDGPCLEPHDHERLSRQLDKVRDLMKDGAWRSLPMIRAAVGAASEAGVSARLRDLRKPKFGGYEVQRKREGNLFYYRLVV